MKVKPPTDHIEQKEAAKAYENVPKATLAERIQHVVQSSFNGKRIVIFSGGVTKGTPELLEELRQIAKGGANGSIMGRNAFQRSQADGAKLLRDAMEIFKNA